MTTRLIILWSTIFLLWALAIPIAFVTLYTAIELQSAARSLAKGDTRLAPLNTYRLAKHLDAAEEEGQKSDQIVSDRNTARQSLFEARTRVRATVSEMLARRGVENATQGCTADEDTLKKCQIEYDALACAKDWMKIQQCYDRALVLTSHESSSDPMREAKALLLDARSKGYAFNAKSARLREENKIEADPLFPVAEVLRSISIPGFYRFFILPQGVVVACFTSVMAMFGAGVSALLPVLRRNVSVRDNPQLLRRFVYAPLLGGLTGFLVYFVVSAGTAFLVQPAPADPAQATNNLSAPALASLGILAGLAAEDAIAWLREKASAFFRTTPAAPQNANRPATDGN